MRSTIASVLCALIIAGCQQEKNAAKPSAKPRVADARSVKVDALIPPAPVFIDHSVLGSALGPDGTAINPSLVFPPGKPIYLTLFLRESPGGLVTTAIWSDAADKPVFSERKPMNGAKIATFTLNDPKLKRGRYHVIGYWGEDIAADYRFEIGTAPKANRKKG